MSEESGSNGGKMNASEMEFGNGFVEVSTTVEAGEKKKLRTC